MPRPRSPHEAALDALVPRNERADYERRRRALMARQTTLDVIDSSREAQNINKTQLAHLAGLEPSSVRRMLTATTANPTAENTFLLLSAVGVGLEAVLPSGERVSILESGHRSHSTKQRAPQRKPARARRPKRTSARDRSGAAEPA